MNKDILKSIKSELKDDMKQRGFKTEGQWYMRLANSQVYQMVYFQGSMGGYQFCINIYQQPIFNGIDRVKGIGSSIRLGMLAYQYDYWWDYSEDSVKDVTTKIHEIAFPLLDSCTTYRKLFEYIKPVMNAPANNEKRLESSVFYQLNEIDRIRLMISLDETECCENMLKKSINNQSEVIQYDRVFEERIAKTNDPEEIQRLKQIMEKRKEDFTELMNKDKSYLAMIESGDLSEFKAEIAENERKSLDTLQKYIVKIKDGKILKE